MFQRRKTLTALTSIALLISTGTPTVAQEVTNYTTITSENFSPATAEDLQLSNYEPAPPPYEPPQDDPVFLDR